MQDCRRLEMLPAVTDGMVDSGASAEGGDADGRFTRSAAAWTLGVAGLMAYNWWVLIPLKPGLMRSPNELFSNLEVTGQPYAAAMQHADLLAGLLLLGAFLAAGSNSLAGARREWLGLVTFAAACGIGGIFPQVCDDGLSPACMSQEWHFRLDPSQYLHDAAGVTEFAAITIVLLLASRRTRDDQATASRTYRHLVLAAFVAYPLLGLAYLTNILGSVIEAAFFVGFTVIVVTQLAERTRATSSQPTRLGGRMRGQRWLGRS